MKRIVRRAWGWYFVLLDREHFKVKLLWFIKGKKLSLQKHEKRGEAWMILKGKGVMSYCPEELIVNGLVKGDYYHIPKGSWHRYEAKENSLILEIQYGDRCEESDIIRI